MLATLKKTSKNIRNLTSLNISNECHGFSIVKPGNDRSWSGFDLAIDVHSLVGQHVQGTERGTDDAGSHCRYRIISWKHFDFEKRNVCHMQIINFALKEKTENNFRDRLDFHNFAT